MSHACRAGCLRSHFQRSSAAGILLGARFLSPFFMHLIQRTGTNFPDWQLSSLAEAVPGPLGAKDLPWPPKKKKKNTRRRLSSNILRFFSVVKFLQLINDDARFARNSRSKKFNTQTAAVKNDASEIRRSAFYLLMFLRRFLVPSSRLRERRCCLAFICASLSFYEAAKRARMREINTRRREREECVQFVQF